MKPLVVAGVIVLVLVGVVFGIRRYALWHTVCTAASPDGRMKATVRCHYIPVAMDGRYHYYLKFDPRVQFRPVDCQSTLKTTASAVKRDCVASDWRDSHYIGYLQGFDGIPEREPSAIEWESSTVAIVKSRSGIAAKVELR